MSLKHGKSPRASAKPSVDHRTTTLADTTPLVVEPLMNGATPFAVVDVVEPGGVDHSALPVLDHLFPFPSPPLDLAEDWGSWSHQNHHHSVAPVASDTVGQKQMDSNDDMAELVGSVPFLCIYQLTRLRYSSVSTMAG